MTLAITNRYQVGSTASTTFKTSSSFTPSASSKLYVMGWGQALAGGPHVLAVTDSLGTLTWSQKATAGTPSAGFRSVIYLWETTIGASPSAMTVTVTSSGATTPDVTMAVFEVTGNSPQIKSGQVVAAHQAAPATITTGTLPAAATSGNLVILTEGANRDSFTAITTPADMTLLARTSAGSQYEQVSVVYSTTFTGTSDTHSNSPDNEDAGTVLFEIEEAGGGSTDPGYGYVLQESGGNDRITLEDSSGFLLLDTAAAAPIPPDIVLPPRR